MLIAPVGKDPFGRMLGGELVELGMRTDGLIYSNERTGLCNMFLDESGNLVGGVADMGITTHLPGRAVRLS